MLWCAVVIRGYDDQDLLVWVFVDPKFELSVEGGEWVDEPQPIINPGKTCFTWCTQCVAWRLCCLPLNLVRSAVPWDITPNLFKNSREIHNWTCRFADFSFPPKVRKPCESPTGCGCRLYLQCIINFTERYWQDKTNWLPEYCRTLRSDIHLPLEKTCLLTDRLTEPTRLSTST